MILWKPLPARLAGAAVIAQNPEHFDLTDQTLYRADQFIRGIADCARHLAVLERYLGERPWLSGGEFGIGDIPMGVYAYTWFSLPFDKPEFPAVSDWYARIRERPGFAEQVMIPLT